jgi:hypothetical protein
VTAALAGTAWHADCAGSRRRHGASHGDAARPRRGVRRRSIRRRKRPRGVRQHGERSDSTTFEERASGERHVALTDAAAELCAAVDALTRAFLDGTAVEKATARDRFQVALAAFTAQIDAP